MRLNHWLMILGIVVITHFGMDCKCEDTKTDEIHPALLPPNGRTGGSIGATLTNWEDVLKLGKLYRETKDSEIHDEYFWRLLAYFKISVVLNGRHLVGMKGLKRSDIEAVFGKGRATDSYESWFVPRGDLSVTFKNEICIDAEYNEGF